jgi:cardiolipin synthase
MGEAGQPWGASALVRDLRTWPNIVSLARVVLVYVALILFHFGEYRIGLAIGVAAGLSDYLDGYLARRLNQATRIGALVDQAADLLFMTGCIFVFVNEGTWPAVLLFVVLLREVTVLCLRASAGEMGFALPSIFLGKWASNWMFYSLALMGAVRGHWLPAAVEPWVHRLSDFAMVVGVTSSVVTAIIYLRSYARQYVPKPRA